VDNAFRMHRLQAGSTNQNLYDLITRSGLPLAGDCGGTGICGNCRVQVHRGRVSPPHPDELEYLSREELASGVRLACRCQAAGEITLSIPESAVTMQILEKTRSIEIELAPPVGKESITLDPQSDESMYGALLRQSSCLTCDPAALLPKIPDMPPTLTMVRMNGELIGLETGDTRSHCYGVAVDIGTTTIVAELVDVNDGRSLATASMINPQFSLGADVLSRIHYAGQDERNLHKLTSLLTDALNSLITQLCSQAAVVLQHCYLISVAANTAMMHMLLGVDPRSLGRYPYRPVFKERLQVRAADCHIKAAPGAILQCLPAISGFVGADISAGLLALDLFHSPGNNLFIDMGTNGEIVLAVNGRLTATSAAAGPALEGMNISCGMKASPGAIDHVKMRDNDLVWTTINNSPAQGLCGSGLLDLTACLVDAGVIQRSGRIIPPGTYPWGAVKDIDNTRCFEILPPSLEAPRGIYLSQQDIRQVQLAKGALAAGIQLLLQETGIAEGSVDRVYLAGAFGSYLKPAALITLGLFPQLWRDRITYAGNTSLAGARMALLNSRLLEAARPMLKHIDYLDLGSCDDFNRRFTRAMSFTAG